jgi:serine/threonine protein kinase
VSLPIKLLLTYLKSRAIRKEIPYDDTTVEERQILEFLARCGKPNFVRLLFWYQYNATVNYVFPHYPGSLHQLLEGKLDSQMSPLMPSKYSSNLQHFLWQGMVDVIAAMKFLHFPDQKILPGLVAAHFDLKPSNILVDESGGIVLTGFGQARIQQWNSTEGAFLTASDGDPNYKPPPFSPSHKQLLNSVGRPDDPAEDVTLRRKQAYDVWSLACIMIEIIEYIQRGPDGFRSFRDQRFREDKSSRAFWKTSPGGHCELKASVQETLRTFRTVNDRYLNMVTDLLESMLSIDPLQRPTMADCFAVVSEHIPTDEWPVIDNNEFSICGPGTNPQLKTM